MYFKNELCFDLPLPCKESIAKIRKNEFNMAAMIFQPGNKKRATSHILIAQFFSIFSP